MAQGMEFRWRNSREKMLADEEELAQLVADSQKAYETEQLIKANANIPNVLAKQALNWRNSREKMLADEAELAQLDYDMQKAHEMDQLIKANANATKAYKLMELGNQLNSSEAMQDVQKTLLGQKEMEAQREDAERQRWMELEKQQEERKSSIQNDPRMQMAAMLAMGGQSGALQNLLVSSVQQDIAKEEKARAEKKQAQTQMDALENSVSNSLTLLAGMNQDQIDKFKSYTLPTFRSRFLELEDAGAVSRLGGLDSWMAEFDKFGAKGNDKRNAANKKKNRDSKLGFK